MADSARRLDPKTPSDPNLANPVRPMPGPTGVLPPELDSRYEPANQDPRVDNRTVVEKRGAGNGVIIAAVVVVLAIIAYFMFAPRTNAPAPTEPATTSEPATPAPGATAPAAPATPAAPAPDAAAPATPAPNAAAPAEPAKPAPATPAPVAPAN